MKNMIFKVIMFGLLIGFICTLTSMSIGLLIYFIALGIDSPLALTILKFATFISFGLGVLGMISVYIYFAFLVKHFIKNGVKL